MKKKKDVTYHLRCYCEICGQTYWMPNYMGPYEDEVKLARKPYYDAAVETLKGAVKIDPKDRVIEKLGKHASLDKCVVALKTYIDDVKSELENSIPSECSCCQRY